MLHSQVYHFLRMSKILLSLIVAAINNSREEFGKQHLQFSYSDSDHVWE